MYSLVCIVCNPSVTSIRVFRKQSEQKKTLINDNMCEYLIAFLFNTFLTIIILTKLPNNISSFNLLVGNRLNILFSLVQITESPFLILKCRRLWKINSQHCSTILC